MLAKFSVEITQNHDAELMSTTTRELVLALTQSLADRSNGKVN